MESRPPPGNRGSADVSARPDVTETVAPDAFKAAFRGHPAGVTIITADGVDGPVGLTATSVFSVSADPPIFAFSLSTSSTTSEAIINGDTIVAHLLSVDQLDAARLFSTSGIDRFADTTTWGRLESGEPYLLDAPIWIRGRIIERLRMQAGDAKVVACHALQAQVASGDHAPLIYHNRTWHRIGRHSELTD